MEKRILIIEDEKFLRLLLASSFKKEGLEVFEAIDWEEGFKILEEQKIDLIVLDILLPGIDGVEILTQLKKDSRFNQIPVLVLSNLGQEEKIEECKKRGAVDYLIKANYTLGEIVERIKKYL
jgi:DNA-binding response OmpR family regulator